MIHSMVFDWEKDHDNHDNPLIWQNLEMRQKLKFTKGE